jgi:hypothetical protein
MVFLLFFKILAKFIFLYCRFLVNLHSEMRKKDVHLTVFIFNRLKSNKLRKTGVKYR